MKGLLFKDSIYLNRSATIFLIITTIIALFFLYLNLNGTAMGIIMLMFGFIATSGFLYDDKVNWNKFALSMPIKRSDIVNSKYAMMYILIGIGAMVGLGLISLYGFLNENVEIMKCIQAWVVMLASVLGCSNIVMPLFLNANSEITRYLSIGLFILPTVFVAIYCGFMLDSGYTIDSRENFLHLCIIAAAILLMFFCYIISRNVIKNKEF